MNDGSSGVEGRTPIFYPPKAGITNDDNDETHSTTFVEACLYAAEHHRPLHLMEDTNEVSETIVLRKRQHLVIRGESSSSSLSRGRIRLAGKTHSLFLLNNYSQLKLVDLEVVHEDDGGEDCRKVGAAVNLRYKSKVWIEGSSLKSYAGFCCWAVQKSGVFFERSQFEAPLRSALVCFGQTRLEGRSSTIANVGVHGVCARGECLIRLINCSILDSAVRGLYAYANASVELDSCSVRGTVRPDMAAIEVSSAVSAERLLANTNDDSNKSTTSGKTVHDVLKTSSLFMNDCSVTDNAGVGVRIRGGVRHNFNPKNNEDETLHDYKANHFSRNLGGDAIDFRPTSAEEDEKQNIDDDNNLDENRDHNESQTKPRRDASGSSFRKGDWWCSGCVPKRIVQSSRDTCPWCNLDKSNGEFLSTEEVIKLNRGESSMALSIGSSPSPIKCMDQEDKITVASLSMKRPTWWFDGDDGGWIPYDKESCQKLESAFQSRLMGDQNLCNKDSDGSSSHIVLLSSGNYRVDLNTMEQTNTISHFLRLVKRKEN